MSSRRTRTGCCGPAGSGHIPASGSVFPRGVSGGSRRLTVRGGAPRLSQEAAMEKLDRITTDAARMNGEPCIRNLRLTVRRVLEALATFPDRAELKREYPELEDEDIRQALAFAAALIDDKVLPLPPAR